MWNINLFSYFYLLIILDLVVKQSQLSSSKTTAESVVIEGTYNNFDKLKNSTRFLVVEFFYTECDYCKNFEPVYISCAKQLSLKYSKNEISFVSIDVASYPELSTKYKVSQFPTIILLSQNSEGVIDYNGDLNEKDFLHWVYKKTFNSVIVLKDQNDYRQYVRDQLDQARSSLVYVKDGISDTNVEFFANLGMSDDHFDYAILENSFEELKPGNFYINKYDSADDNKDSKEELISFKSANKNYNKEEVQKFIYDHAYSSILPFTYLTSELLFARYKPAFFIYRNLEDANKYDKTLLEASRLYKKQNKESSGTIFFFTCGNDTDMEVNFNQHFENTFPKMVIHDTSDPKVVMQNILFEDKFSAENIVNFISTFFDNKKIKEQQKIIIEKHINNTMNPNSNLTEIDKDLLSSPELTEMYKTLHRDLNSASLTEETYEEFIKNETRSCMLLIYGGEEDISNAFYSTFENFANSINEDSYLALAKMKYNANHKYSFDIGSIPNIIFINTDKKVIRYNQKIVSYSKLKEFVELNIGRKVDDLSDVSNPYKVENDSINDKLQKILNEDDLKSSETATEKASDDKTDL